MLTVRHIKTNEKNEPELDGEGREIELWSVSVPADIEAEGGAAIDAYVAAEHAKAVTVSAAQPEDVTDA